MMEHERVDLSALGLGTDELRQERLVRRIMDAAEPELRRRASVSNPLAMLAGWARPMLAAAAVMALLAIGALAVTERAGAAGEQPGTVAEALGLPTPAADWVSERRQPTTSDLVLAVERRP